MGPLLCTLLSRMFCLCRMLRPRPEPQVCSEVWLRYAHRAPFLLQLQAPGSLEQLAAVLLGELRRRYHTTSHIFSCLIRKFP